MKNLTNFPKSILAILCVSLTIYAISCKTTDSKPVIPNTAVMAWNLAGTTAIARMGSGPDAIPPMVESRIYAMLNIAMHDALNNIDKRFSTYAFSGTLVTDASPDAAVAAAAHDVLVAMLPPQKAFADSLYHATLAIITDANAKTKGAALGQAAAAAMLAKRTNDGADVAQTGYTAGTAPGNYRATPPFDGPPFNGFVAVPAWGKIKPFALTSPNQFRVVADYAVNSPEYTTDFNEIKAYGGAKSTARTADQTQIGLFWLENAPLGWNRIARSLVTQKSLDAWDTAKLFALLQMAEADANIGSFDGKFTYNFWRPITAVRLADNDGNNDTVGDPTWDVLAPPTPPIPDYPSNHAVNGGAAAEILKSYFGNDNISFTATSSSLAGVSRNYTSFSQAARDNSLSRIYVGYHFRNAVLKGEDQGRQIGAYVFANWLK